MRLKINGAGLQKQVTESDTKTSIKDYSILRRRIMIKSLSKSVQNLILIFWSTLCCSFMVSDEHLIASPIEFQLHDVVYQKNREK